MRRRRQLVLDLRDTPEQEEGDATDGHFPGARHDRVAQLVQQDAAEECQGREERHEPVHRPRGFGCDPGVVPLMRPGNPPAMVIVRRARMMSQLASTETGMPSRWKSRLRVPYMMCLRKRDH